MAKTEVMAQNAWGQARSKNDFPAFQPWLEKWLDLKIQQANCYGYTGHIYNALLEDFEPGETAENLSLVFESLRAPLVELIGKIVASGRKAPLEPRPVSRIESEAVRVSHRRRQKPGGHYAEALFKTVEPEPESGATRLHRLGRELDAVEVTLFVDSETWLSQRST